MDFRASTFGTSCKHDKYNTHTNINPTYLNVCETNVITFSRLFPSNFLLASLGVHIGKLMLFSCPPKNDFL